MNIEGGTANAMAQVQAEVQVGMQKKALDITADLNSTIIQGGTQAADQARASQGIGTNINAVA